MLPRTRNWTRPLDSISHSCPRTRQKNIPEQLATDLAIVKAINAVDRMFNEEERNIYEVRMEVIADVESKIASALEEGEAKGIEKGITQGAEKNQRTMVQQAHKAGVTSKAIAEMFSLEH